MANAKVKKSSKRTIKTKNKNQSQSLAKSRKAKEKRQNNKASFGAKSGPQSQQNLGTDPFDASFSMLLMSLASSAAMSMGLTPNPQTGSTNVDSKMAKFNIDLLMILQQKTTGNLTTDEKRFLDAIVSDLQLKFVNVKGASL